MKNFDNSYYRYKKNVLITSSTFPYQSCTGGTIQKGEVKNALHMLGCKIPNHEVRELLDNLERQNRYSDGALNQELFKEVS